MRKAGAASFMIVALAACGSGSAADNGAREQFKTEFVESCVPAARGTPVQANATRICNCAIDRYMADRTTEQLHKMNPQDPALREASQRCATEQRAADARSGGDNEAAPGNDEAPIP